MSTGHFQKVPQNGRFMIGSVPELGNDEITVEAQYNPKELQIESPMGWVEHHAFGHQAVATKPMEFTGMGAETVKVELTFDAFEDNSDLVVESIAKLKTMASVRKPDSSKIQTKRTPSFCVATWGTQAPFRCVIESINVKYTMFALDGTPVRATVVLSLKSGCRSIEKSEETAFERASRERTEARRERQDRNAREREERAKADEADRAARYKASEADRRLAERESRADAERQELAARRAIQEREVQQRAERIERERRVAEDERAVAEERERMRRERVQREKDFDLE